MQALNIISLMHVKFPRCSWAHCMAVVLAISPPVAESLPSSETNCKCGKLPDLNGHHLWLGSPRFRMYSKRFARFPLDESKLQ